MVPDRCWDSALASGARDDLAQLAQEAGCQDGTKAARNLLDLQAHMQDPDLLWRCLQSAAASADPDQALTLLDRLLQQLPAQELPALLQAEEACGGLLLLLGGSQLAGQILCRRPQLLAPLIQQQRWQWQRQEQDLTTELSELVGEEPDFATLQSRLRQFKYAELLRICWRDLAGWADVPQITAELSREKGWRITRVSDRVRNPLLGTPDAWEQKVLAEFRQRAKDGASYKGMTYSEVVKEPAGEYYRFMKAIPLQGKCMACHGPKKNLAPAVLETLEKRYPHDQATGYAVGDLRGAFSIKRPLEQ